MPAKLRSKLEIHHILFFLRIVKKDWEESHASMHRSVMVQIYSNDGFLGAAAYYRPEGGHSYVDGPEFKVKTSVEVFGDHWYFSQDDKRYLNEVIEDFERVLKGGFEHEDD